VHVDLDIDVALSLLATVAELAAATAYARTTLMSAWATAPDGEPGAAASSSGGAAACNGHAHATPPAALPAASPPAALPSPAPVLQLCLHIVRAALRVGPSNVLNVRLLSLHHDSGVGRTSLEQLSYELNGRPVLTAAVMGITSLPDLPLGTDAPPEAAAAPAVQPPPRTVGPEPSRLSHGHSGRVTLEHAGSSGALRAGLENAGSGRVTLEHQRSGRSTLEDDETRDGAPRRACPRYVASNVRVAPFEAVVRAGSRRVMLEHNTAALDLGGY
jgi:hypothetical protein